MPAPLTILHGGALGDLVLTIQLALRLPGAGEADGLHLVARSNPGDLSACRPRITRQSPEGLGMHWLFGDHDDHAPEPLRTLVRGRHVLNALAGRHTVVHHRLLDLQPAGLLSIDSRARPGADRHITEQWRTQLEAQGLLVPKCIHQKPHHRGLGVAESLRQSGQTILRNAGCDPDAPIIHPGSGGRSKCWPPPCFVEVARDLRAAQSVEPAFLIGPVELERWPAADVDELAHEFPLLRDPEADALAAVLAASRVVIGNDAGPAHLAALLGTPTFTVFGPTSAHVWRPLGAAAQVVAGDPERGSDWGVDPASVAALAAAQIAG